MSQSYEPPLSDDTAARRTNPTRKRGRGHDTP